MEWIMVFKTKEKVTVIERHDKSLEGYALNNAMMAVEDAQKRAKKNRWYLFSVKERM